MHSFIGSCKGLRPERNTLCAGHRNVRAAAASQGPGGEATTIALNKGTTQVAFRLEVESDAYPRFWAAVKDVASNAIVWRSPDVAAEPAGANRIATIVVPAEILRPQRYAIELAGVSKTGESELLGVYAVDVKFE